MMVTYDDMCFDEARDGFEDALCAVRLLFAPEGKAFREVLVARFSLNIEYRKSGDARTSTCARHFEWQVEGPRRIESIVYSV